MESLNCYVVPLKLNTFLVIIHSPHHDWITELRVESSLVYPLFLTK